MIIIVALPFYVCLLPKSAFILEFDLLMGTSYIVWVYIQVLLPSLLFGKISETPLTVIVMKWIINFSLGHISNQELCEETAKQL